MLLGMAVVTVIYLAVNASFLHVLGFDGLASSEAVAAETVASAFPKTAGSLVSALICLCALSAGITGSSGPSAGGRSAPARRYGL
jgi:hypothetical protein